MAQILVKPGVEFGDSFAPAGARILEALKQIVRYLGFDVTITSARDGEHSGPEDPHHKGEAFDIRTHDLSKPQKDTLLGLLKARLGDIHFFAFLEAAGTPNEHIHVQRKKGTTYSPLDYLQAE